MGELGSLRGLRPDGEEFPIEATITEIKSGGIKVFGIVIRDPADHPRTEEGLTRSEESYREIVLRSPIAMVLTRFPDQRCEVLNDQFTNLFGYTIQDVPDVAHWWPLAYPDETYREKVKAEWQERVQRALELNCNMEPMEAIVRCKDGSTRYIEFHFAAVSDAFLVSFVDLSERRRIEMARSETEERFRVMADAAPVMIWMASIDKRCTYFSKPWLNFTGRLLEQELGDGWAEGVHEADRSQCFETYIAAFDRRESFRMEYRLRRYDGVYRWVYDTGVPRYDSDGEFAGYIGSCIDVTERKAVETAVSTLGQRLIHAQEEERSRIARELHDDIGQRLAILSIGLEDIRTAVRESSNLVLEQIEETVEKARELGRDVQSISHRLHSAVLEQLGLVMAAAGLCREISERKSIQVDFRSEGMPRNLSKDVAICLFRVLQGALQNVVKHSGARVCDVSLVGTPKEIVLTVHDSGIGFDPQDAEKSTGLGLTSMRERLKFVHGDLSILSQPQRGTTIRARVPLPVVQ